MTKKTKTTWIPEARIDAEIALIGKANETLQKRVHRAAMSILFIWQANSAAKRIEGAKAHGAAIVAADRLTALGNNVPYYRNSLFKWILHMTPLLWDAESKSFQAAPGDTSRFMGESFITARDTPFYIFKPAPAATPFDLGEFLEKLVVKVEKRTKAGIKEGDHINLEALKFLREARDLHKAQ